MPAFEEKACTKPSNANVCIEVTFPNGMVDLMFLNRTSSSIYEGQLKDDNDVGVVMIDSPQEQTRLVIHG